MNQFIEATSKQEKDGDINHILGPKTKETELRLGFVSDSFGSDPISAKAPVEKGSSTKRLITSPSDEQTLFVNGAAGHGNTKRWCSDHDHLTTQGGGGYAKNNPWSNNCFSDPKKENSAIQSPPVPATRAAPVVGWPPVRAFRRNLTSPSKQGMKNKAVATTDDEVLRKSAAVDTMYVKVNMEGYAVGRKINLKAHESYESLSQALQEMFGNFLSSVNFSNGVKAQDETQPKEEQGSKHVLLYEDNEGDRILVGDVPWEMFTRTAKRLFIISGSKTPAIVDGREARG